jgi:16S rRNA (uracil1498-N3)-methyltransferase
MLPRIYTNTPIKIDNTLTLSKETSHHLITVLRMKTGGTVLLFNGEPGDFKGEIETTGKRVDIKITEFIPCQTESALFINLGQGISRGDRMDFTLQKATELGVSRLSPLITEKCQVKLKDDRTDRKVTHWEHILISAAEQSGRTELPSLDTPISLQKWVTTPFCGLSLVLDPNAADSLKDISQQPTHIRLLIGPESGLTEQEIILAKQNGFQAIRLGPRILRTETAGLAILSAIQSKFGDLS